MNETTRSRLEKYHAYIAENDLVRAKEFLEVNQHDKRFLSLVQLRTDFLNGFKEELAKYFPI
jgi:hypothetical protein